MKSLFTTIYLLFSRYSWLSTIILSIIIINTIAEYYFKYELPIYLTIPILILLWMDVIYIIFRRSCTPLNYARLTDYQKFLYNQINK